MALPANVRSVQSLEQFKVSLIRFEEEASTALSVLRQELHRFLNWLEHDCPAYWKQQIRRAEDAMMEARNELHRKQMITVAGHRPECIEEKKAVEKARRRVQYARRKIEIVRQWNMKAQHVADEYNAQVSRLDQGLAHDLPQMVALLERMLGALHAYADIDKSSSSSGGGSSSTTKETAGSVEAQADSSDTSSEGQ